MIESMDDAVGVLLNTLDRLKLSGPRWTGEVFRSYGTYAWFRSDKAVRELAYVVRPLPQIVDRAVGRSS